MGERMTETASTHGKRHEWDRSVFRWMFRWRSEKSSGIRAAAGKSDVGQQTMEGVFTEVNGLVDGT